MPEFDVSVKRNIYETIAEFATMPTASDVATRLDSTVEEVLEAFHSLNQQRLLVLEPGMEDRIRMAPPFSGIETPFQAKCGGKTFYANCAWDAYGVLAALQNDGSINAWDAYSHEPISLFIKGGQPKLENIVVHFAVPAAHWWDDIIYT
jgi:hypothetical protein